MRRFTVFSLAFAFVVVLATPNMGLAGFLQVGTRNRIDVRNLENVYRPNAAGTTATKLAAGSSLAVGDIFAGVFEVQQTVISGGFNPFVKNPGVHEVSGVFAQRIAAIHSPGSDPFDAAQTSLTHLQLETVAVAGITFSDGAGDTFSLPLAAGEMFAIFEDFGGVPFSSAAPASTSVASAADGTKVAGIGISPGTDGSTVSTAGDPVPGGANDDPSFFYSHSALEPTDPVANFTSAGFAQMDVTFSGPGFPSIFIPLNTANEVELGGPGGVLGGPAGLFNDVVGDVEIGINDFGPLAGGAEPWDFNSEDPLFIHPVPEPSSLMLCGLGALALMGHGWRRRRKQGVNSAV